MSADASRFVSTTHAGRRNGATRPGRGHDTRSSGGAGTDSACADRQSCLSVACGVPARRPHVPGASHRRHAARDARGRDRIQDQQTGEVLGREIMKVDYDPRTDTLTVVLKEDTAVADSDEEKPGIILDFDVAGDLVSLEILDASRRVSQASKVEFKVAV